jgi:multicomponent Na+:H+ antiporter subunit D
VSADWILVLPVMLPLLAGLIAVVAPRIAQTVGMLTVVANLALVLLLALRIVEAGALEQQLGSWAPPLGIALRLDGLAASMLLMTAMVAVAISVYAASYFSRADARGFWPLWLLLLASLAALFLSRDLFNLYVTLELLGISAVALTALGGGREALTAAMRYLLASLRRSLAYLMGVALTYHGAGSVDLTLVADRFGSQSGAAQTLALGLMTAGLLFKGALFPLHFWLPPAHGSAAAPVSAALSALVVKGAFFILLRLWLEAFPAPRQDLFGVLADARGRRRALGLAAGDHAGAGEAADRLLDRRPAGIPVPGSASGYCRRAGLGGNRAAGFCHGLAKASMFLAVGNLQSYAGHDRIAELGSGGAAYAPDIAALGLGGVSIMGLPPSGGFNAKWLLLQSAARQGRWDIAAVLLIGGLLAAIYSSSSSSRPSAPGTRSVTREGAALPGAGRPGAGRAGTAPGLSEHALAGAGHYRRWGPAGYPGVCREQQRRAASGTDCQLAAAWTDDLRAAREQRRTAHHAQPRRRRGQTADCGADASGRSRRADLWRAAALPAGHRPGAARRFPGAAVRDLVCAAVAAHDRLRRGLPRGLAEPQPFLRVLQPLRDRYRRCGPGGQPAHLHRVLRTADPVDLPPGRASRHGRGPPRWTGLSSLHARGRRAAAAPWRGLAVRHYRVLDFAARGIVAPFVGHGAR